jgi:hypothetical protein
MGTFRARWGHVFGLVRPTDSGEVVGAPIKMGFVLQSVCGVPGVDGGAGPTVFPPCLRGKAFDLYENQSVEAKRRFYVLRDTFTTYFVPSTLNRMLEAENVFNGVLQNEASIRDYVHLMVTLSRRLTNVYSGTLQFLVIKGFKPPVKGYVLPTVGTMPYPGRLF